MPTFSSAVPMKLVSGYRGTTNIFSTIVKTLGRLPMEGTKVRLICHSPLKLFLTIKNPTIESSHLDNYSKNCDTIQVTDFVNAYVVNCIVFFFAIFNGFSTIFCAKIVKIPTRQHLLTKNGCGVK